MPEWDSSTPSPQNSNSPVLDHSLASRTERKDTENLMTTVKILFFLALLLFFVQRLPGQTERKSITSWVPSREEIGFVSTAHLPRGAEVRILVVKTGHSSGEVRIYSVSPQ